MSPTVFPWGRVRRICGWTVIALALAVVVIEAVGRTVSERIVEDQIRSSGVAGGVEVTVGRSWWQPSIVGVLLFNALDQIDVRLDDARLYSTRINQADYVLRGLDLDLSFRERTVSVRSIGSGTVRVLIDPSVIATMLGTDASIRGGQLFLGDETAPSQVRVDGTDLVVSGASVKRLAGSDSISLPVADSQILPCSPKVRLVDRFVELGCSGNTLPGVLSTSLAADGSSVDNGRIGNQGGEPGGDHQNPPPDQVDLPPPATLELPSSTAPAGRTGGD